jgi:transposase
MGNTLEKYRFGILNWYKYPITSGQLEGINNKIKALFRRGYGFKNFETIKYRLYAIHESRNEYTRL